MAASNQPILLLSNTALNVGDTTFNPGPTAPAADGQLPVRVQVWLRVHSVVTGNVTARVEYSADNTNWFGGDPAQAMTAIAAAGGAAKAFDLQYPHYRIVVNLSAGSAAISLWASTT